MKAADERPRVGRGRGGDALAGEPGADEAIHRVGGAGDLRQRGADRGLEGPMRGLRGALGDPTPEEVRLRGGQGLLGFGRRHHLVRMRRGDAVEQLAVGRSARHHGDRAAFGWFPGGGRKVEAQAALARGVIGSVAVEAVAREDGPDVAVVVHGRAGRGGREECRGEGGGGETGNGAAREHPG